MLQYLATEHGKYSVVFFITYLYAPTYFGSQVVPTAKTILAPTAHDEAVIFVPACRSMFQRIGAFAFLTPEERRFVTETFGIEHAYRATIGMPVSVAQDLDEAEFRCRHRIRGPFLLYAGRIDPTKGCADLFNYYAMSRKYLRHDAPLILIGSRQMNIPHSRHIRYLGHLSEEDKASAMAAATVVINPSPFESFSIVTLEAMAAGAPVLVNGQSEVLKGHVQRSSAGLYYEGGAEFVEALRLLLFGSAEWRQRLSQNGRAYVNQNYDQAIMAERYRRLVEHVMLKSSEMERIRA
jgi:glycosyltransferase involved in cell wall biosynthesis